MPDIPSAGHRPLRVMHLVYGLRTGGMERNVVKLANALDPALIETSVCSCVAADDLKRALNPEVPLVELGRREGTDMGMVARLVQVFKRYRPDILHTHAWGTLCEGVVAARLAGVPAIVHGEHGTLQTKWRQRVMQRIVWGQVDRVLSVSKQLAERMSAATRFPLARIEIIPNGLDLGRFDASARDAARRDIGARPDDVVVGTVGRLVPVKDFGNFLEALAITRREGLATKGVLVGDGPLRGDLAERVADLGLGDHVRLLGHRDDVERVLAAFDVFVCSSESEGLSNTIMEAMASRVAVVATDVGGNAELVDAGVTGLLVPAKSPGHLAQAIAALARDGATRDAMARAGRQRVEAHFSIDRMVERYSAFYLAAARTVVPR